MAFKKGNKYRFKKNNPGKKKGTLNKFTTLKNAFLKAFQEIQKDKKVRLDKWGKMNPEMFYRLISKMLPREIELTGKNKEPVKIEITDAKKK